ncbi:type II secretion system minor pseudopilin GspK [Leclercia adecarboxylata]|uniref:type II secretion system minor pseudopilin GspK n=1 Tax=Leclercia adecarboxylata TaxID=83655 RepID=UPI002DBA9C08|nr:type II secretion system minor pseudopilin GspK [Leclercia adecarboxylata]MEB6379134.1 type II secretion system minor pseudopilin GspK [Leclercia adecarboxylata]
MKRAGKQQGVALLVVLILLVMMSALAARISQQFCRNLQKTHYQVSQQQLRWAMLRQEQVINARLLSATGGEKNVLTLKGEWHAPLETRGEHYTLVSQVEDAQNCFNVNNLLAVPDSGAQEKTPPAAADTEKPRQQQIVERLLVDSGVSTMMAQEIYLQLVDYLDEDTTTASEGREDDAWAGLKPARLPANRMMRNLNELKLLPAFPAVAWAKARNLFCALPTTSSRVDVNTLPPQQAGLLAALFPGKLTEAEAKRVIEARPEAGWESVNAFSETLAQNAPQLKDDLKQAADWFDVTSRYFQVNYTGNTDELTLRVVSQLRAEQDAGEVRTWQRRYRMIE